MINLAYKLVKYIHVLVSVKLKAENVDYVSPNFLPQQVSQSETASI